MVDAGRTLGAASASTRGAFATGASCGSGATRIDAEIFLGAMGQAAWDRSRNARELKSIDGSTSLTGLEPKGMQQINDAR